MITRRVERFPLRFHSVRIEWEPGGTFNVIREDGKETGELSWDEMLGTIAELTHPGLGRARYRFSDERAEREARYRRMHGPLLLEPPATPKRDATLFDAQCPLE